MGYSQEIQVILLGRHFINLSPIAFSLAAFTVQRIRLEVNCPNELSNNNSILCIVSIWHYGRSRTLCRSRNIWKCVQFTIGAGRLGWRDTGSLFTAEAMQMAADNVGQNTTQQQQTTSDTLPLFRRSRLKQLQPPSFSCEISLVDQA